MERPEKRKDRRLGADFDVSFYKVGARSNKPLDGHALNVSSGGLYFETAIETIKQGDLLKVEISVPPTRGSLEFGGRIAAFAKVLRADNIGGQLAGDNSVRDKYGLALEFCHQPKLCI
jgi:PilZ domain